MDYQFGCKIFKTFFSHFSLGNFQKFDNSKHCFNGLKDSFDRHCSKSPHIIIKRVSPSCLREWFFVTMSVQGLFWILLKRGIRFPLNHCSLFEAEEWSCNRDGEHVDPDVGGLQLSSAPDSMAGCGRWSPTPPEGPGVPYACFIGFHTIGPDQLK